MTAQFLAIPDAAAVEFYVAELERDGCPSVPPGALEPVRQALLAKLAPASREEMARALAAMGASFKWPGPDVIMDRQGYRAAMAIELRRYSYHVISVAIGEARRTLPWMPAISEMVALCRKTAAPIRAALRRLDLEEAELRGLLTVQDVSEGLAALPRYLKDELERARKATPLLEALHAEQQLEPDPLAEE